MGKIILDADLKAKLRGLDEELELCEADGRILGHFLPSSLYQELLYAWAKEQVDDEELKRAREEPGGLTTPQAIAYVEHVARSRKQDE